MPVRVIGMIGVTPPASGATVHIIKGGISAPYLKSYAQAHDDAGFDLALVGYTASSAEGFLVAQYAAQHTKRLGYLIAHRPGFVAPTLAARKIATFDHLTEGRIALHIISGASDAEQEGDGDFAPKDVRYRRAAEYIEVMKLAWSNQQALRLRGRVLQGTRRQVGRASAAAAASADLLRRLVGGRAGDGRQALRRVRDVRRAVGADRAAHRRVQGARRPVRPHADLQHVVPADPRRRPRARRGIARAASSSSIQKPGDPTGFGNGKKPLDQSARRLLDFAAQGETHDERLWMPIAEATGAVGNTSCLVGTPEQVARALLEYYKLGVHSFLIRGFDPFDDTIDFGRELIPRLREGAAELDRAKAA